MCLRQPILIFFKARIILLEVIVQPNTTCDRSIDATASGTVTTLDNLIGKDVYRPITPPTYIPHNLGAAATTSLILDIQMMTMFNAQERTLVSEHLLIL